MNIIPLVGLILFFGFIVAFSVILVRTTRRRLISATLASLCASILIQIISYIHLGYIEPFYQIAFVTSLIVGFPISFLISSILLR